MALSDVDEQTQSISQSIIDSDENTTNEVVKPMPIVFTTGNYGKTAAQLKPSD